MDISIDLQVFGQSYTISQELVNSLIVVLVLSIISIIIGIKAKNANFKEKPKGILLLAEIFVEAIEDLVKNTMGKANIGFAPYIGSLALYLAFSNLMGLVGFKPPTSNYVIPFTLAIITTVMIHFNNIRFNGLGSYIKGFFEPIPVMFPINLLGEIANPISLSFRLFGNILSGVIVTTLLYSALSSLFIYITPFVTPVFHVYFDLFAGLIQTFVFIMLTMVNVSLGIGEREL